MISLQKIITKLKSLIDKNTADITALNNSLNNKIAWGDQVFLNNGYATDANQCSRTGIYWTSTATANVQGYGILLVLESSPGTGFHTNNWITQMCFYNYELSIKMRKKIGNDNWTEWQKIA